MKIYVSAVILCLLAACGQPAADTANLQSQIDSLKHKLDKSYRPGLGEFMSGIQVHHAKIWFAGTAGNWALTGFEIGEIRETIDDIQANCTDRPEIAFLPMIKPALDSLDAATKNKSIPQFRSSFILLTNTCNNCHRATRHEFNVIQIPTSPPFNNQSFQKTAQ
jgi:hypothetical protein